MRLRALCGVSITGEESTRETDPTLTISAGVDGARRKPASLRFHDLIPFQMRGIFGGRSAENNPPGGIITKMSLTNSNLEELMLKLNRAEFPLREQN